MVSCSGTLEAHFWCFQVSYCQHTSKGGEEDKLEAWQVKADKAAGIMWLMVESTQRVHFRGIKNDPLEMWKALEDVHMQKRAGTRFNAYDVRV